MTNEAAQAAEQNGQQGGGGMGWLAFLGNLLGSGSQGQQGGYGSQGGGGGDAYVGDQNQGGWLDDILGNISVGKALGNRKRERERKKKIARLNSAISLTQAIQGRDLNRQESLAKLATQQQLSGYDKAQREAGRLGELDKQYAREREAQTIASQSQGLASAGLGSTTLGTNLARGAASDTMRQLRGINEGLAGTYGQLALGRAGVEAAGTGALANIGSSRAALESRLAQMRQLQGATLGQFTVPQFTSQDSGFGGALAQSALGALGSYFGRQNPQYGQMQARSYAGGGPGTPYEQQDLNYYHGV